MLASRYRPVAAKDWWEDGERVEALSALPGGWRATTPVTGGDPPGNLPASNRPTLAKPFGAFSVDVEIEAAPVDQTGRRSGPVQASSRTKHGHIPQEPWPE
jgi:hypothetical protein